MSEKVYTTTNGLSGTLEEFKDMLNGYDLDEVHEFYYGIFDPELKAALKPYFIEKILGYGGIGPE